ncbi:glycosyltransferase family 2 protein [Planktothrix agardhii]|jgi:Glycosyl transferase family 2|uniref:glycosyltransferase family 2 protein n=1 Tax=Planktothrix agardhii TaxID=1160 RepID=UPI001A1E2017|nr:glycosyltransferase family 2 protein [Planktothrix agardhii]MBG0747747.1 glycosyltransferase family 2 protein [Planktothrix agardhii KL2]MCB8764111.1 glycosyltransferase family 2 protein [Planktothrix agardhii 1809]MCB8766676.1 glycosyltransferase family 2 protein [Planktothrix agardhii 1809]MCB8782167.1 glycosyltransferase family 2 protein [Planktothrix agardhii 1808]MCF3566804.1 glycosyltransferase family 2 protein [Planktothrix agardhii 1807]
MEHSQSPSNLPSDPVELLSVQHEEYQTQIVQLQQQVYHQQEEIERYQSQFDEVLAELEQCHLQLHQTKDELQKIQMQLHRFQEPSEEIQSQPNLPSENQQSTSDLINSSNLTQNDSQGSESSQLSAQDLYQPAAPLAETTIIAGVSMFKDEGDIAYANLTWHYQLGIKRFVILDNLSSDNTAGEIRRFADDYSDAQVYLVEDREVAYYQSRKMTAAANLAYKMWGTEWIFPFDADEFLCSFRAPLQTVLESVGSGCKWIKLPWRNHILQHLYSETELNPLKRMSHRLKFEDPDYNLGGFIARWHLEMVVEQGNHVVLVDNQQVPGRWEGEEIGLTLRHYQFRSKDHIRKKIINGGRAYEMATDLTQSFAPHWKQYYQDYRLQGEDFVQHLYNAKINEAQNPIYDPAMI